MISLKLIDTIQDCCVYDVYRDNNCVAGLEIIFQDNINTIYIENIHRDPKYYGQKLLPEVIKYLRDKYKCNIACLPLSKYRSYYESLGFKVSMKSNTNEDDIWYTLDINTKFM